MPGGPNQGDAAEYKPCRGLSSDECGRCSARNLEWPAIETTEIGRMQTKGDAENVVCLLRQFVRWLPERRPDKNNGIDAYFESQALEEQLKSIARRHRRFFYRLARRQENHD